jgi:LysR family glycine cleavage system transcriptional activator
MSRKLPPLKSLRYFDAAAKSLSFTRAAAELFVTQSAVSHQVKALEEYLGVALFIRKNRRLHLTEEGQTYWPAVRKIFEQLADATEQLKSSGASGPLTVSVAPSFAVTWLVPRLNQFNERFPDIDVRMKADDELADFVRDDVDMQIFYGHQEDYSDDLYSQCLLEEKLFPVCSPDLLQGRRRPLESPNDLRYHNLLHDESIDEWKSWLKLAGVEGVNLNTGTIFSHSNLVLQAARYGQGIAIGHSVLAQSDIELGRLVKLFDIELTAPFSYDIVCPEAWSEKPKIKAFREWLIETVSSEQIRAGYIH